MYSRFSIKVEADTPADLELFLKEKLGGMFHSPHLEKLKALNSLGQRGQQLLLSVSQCNDNACSCSVLVVLNPLSISMTSEDAIDCTKDSLGGLGIIAHHRDPGEGGNAS